MPTPLALAPELAGIVRPGALWLDDVQVVDLEPRLAAPLDRAAAALREGHPAAGGFKVDTARMEAHADAVRTMCKRVGLDPTKRRPSSEALLRRIRKGEPLPRVNSLVDVCNWCSVESQLPYGLYDLDRIRGAVTLRLGHPGESYPGIRKDDVHVGGRITLADDDGPFGNPTSDSARTMVTTATTRSLVVLFGPATLDSAMLAHVLDVTAARMHEFTGATETARWLA